MKLRMKKHNQYLTCALISLSLAILSGIWLISIIGCAPTKPWTKTEIALGLTAAVSTGLDWAESRNISRNPERWHEKNGILGDHPETQKVDTYFLSSIILGSLIAHYGPDLLVYVVPKAWEGFVRENFRLVWLGGWTAVEGYTVERNINKGINPRW